ncbi:hypothetical protein Tco_1344503 [Tanacetum coccineum]
MRYTTTEAKKPAASDKIGPSRNDEEIEWLDVEELMDLVVTIITEYLVNISKRRAFWSLNEDILKINDSDYQYAVSRKD